MRESIKDRLRPYVLIARRLRRRELRLVDLAYAHPTFAQFGEDAVLNSLFAGQSEGFYVDVGAYDPFSLSNTYLLYRRGWSGINLEPEPAHFAKVAHHRPRDVCLQLAVSAEVGTVDFVSAGSFSGIAADDYLWKGMGRTISVDTAPLSDVLQHHLPPGQTIDLLDVDCEGHDLAILKTMNWVEHRPRVVLAEWHDEASRKALVRLLTQQRYELIARLGVTGVFVADDFANAPHRAT